MFDLLYMKEPECHQLSDRSNTFISFPWYSLPPYYPTRSFLSLTGTWHPSRILTRTHFLSPDNGEGHILGFPAF